MSEVAIVVASKVGAPFIDRCLESLRVQAEALSAEVIVVAAGSTAYAARLESAFPWARIVHEPGAHSIPALRRRGVGEARSEYIAVIEEHCSAGADWLARGIAAHARGDCAAVGGPIFDSDYDRLADWAVYFLEYHGALPPATAGETTHLNDVNIVYRRDVLLRHDGLLAEGYWLMTLHPTLIAEGLKFLSVPAMVVRHCGPFPFGYYLRQRFLFSRAFAGVRARNEGAARRFAYVFGAPLIPFFLLARIGRTVIAKRCRIGKFVMALPLVAIALVVLVAGEWVGCVFGPGDALAKVE